MTPGELFHTTATLAREYLAAARSRYQSLSKAGKIGVWAFVAFEVAIAVAIIILRPDRIFQFLYDISQDVRRMQLGWLIMGSLIVVGSFPPVIGISTSMMLCGFAWGVQGIFIVAPAATLGACLAFVLLRLFFRKKVKNWTQNVKKWEALESVIEARGLPLIILIRWAPLPWVYSNSFFSSIEAVSLWQFLVATVCFWPKFLLHVFIGSRIALFSDGQQRGEMDALTKALNILSIIVSSLVGMGTGWYVWRLTNRRIKELEALRGDIDEEEGLSNLGEAEAEAPLLRGFSVGIMAIEEEEDRRRSYSPL